VTFQPASPAICRNSPAVRNRATAMARSTYCTAVSRSPERLFSLRKPSKTRTWNPSLHAARALPGTRFKSVV
jgi:hypothetical protein